MKLAIMQPYFLPYLGYFQMMAAVDKFVVLDDVNFIKNGWLNRNRIYSFGKVQWLTLPLSGASSYKLIHDVGIQKNEKSIKKLIKSVEGAYLKAVNFREGFELFNSIMECGSENLSEFVVESLRILHGYFDLNCELIPTSKIYPKSDLVGEDRILDICVHEKVDCYINLPGGKEIYDSARFQTLGIELKFISPQLASYGENFVPGLSVLDLIMNTSRDESSEMVKRIVLDGA